MAKLTSADDIKIRDMYLIDKMSRKISQLTRVVFILNTKKHGTLRVSY